VYSTSITPFICPNGVLGLFGGTVIPDAINNALYAFILPFPISLSELIQSVLSWIILLILSGVRFGLYDNNRAAKPATIGQAIDVPLQ
jgi:hypothetical protein